VIKSKYINLEYKEFKSDLKSDQTKFDLNTEKQSISNLNSKTESNLSLIPSRTTNNNN